MSPYCWSGLSAVLLGGCVFVSDSEFNDRLDLDGDGHQSAQFGGDDCDDGDGSVFPGAAEFCDEVDSDCDGDLDDGQDALDWFEDGDGDGFGRLGSVAVRACSAPVDHVQDASDCDDTDGAINPAALEVCNDGAAVDEDCDATTTQVPVRWFADADGDTFGRPGTPVAVACEGPEGAVPNEGDCDDEDGSVNPDATEVCSNGIDDDCDAATVCVLAGEVQAEDAAVRIFEQRANGILGRGLAVGDGDGNGRKEFYLAQNDPERRSSGRVYVVAPEGVPSSIDLGESGGVDALTADIEGFSESTEFGWSLAVGAISITGDQGLFVGAPNYESRDFIDYGCNGAVFGLDVNRGGVGWAVTQADEVHYMVPASGARMGEAIALAEDFWESGETVLLLGTPGSDPDELDVVHCDALSGTSTGPGGLLLVESQGVGSRLPGGDPLLYDASLLAREGGLEVLVQADSTLGSQAELGAAVAFGDLDGDGRREAVGGAPGARFEGRAGGAVLVYSAELGGDEGMVASASDADLQVFGVQRDARLGAALAVRDLNDDGHEDLVIGAPGLEGTAGSVQVLFFGEGGLPALAVVGEEGVDQTSILGADGLQVGRAVAVSDDLNHDGFFDLLAGGPGDDAAAGQVWGFSGLTAGATLGRTDADFVYTGDGSGDLFGVRIAAPGGLSAEDDDPDLLLAAPARSEGSLVNAGGVWWLPGVGI